MIKTKLYNNYFKNFKCYSIPKAKLIITYILCNLKNNAYASNPTWCVSGTDKNNKSNKTWKFLFNTYISEYIHFCMKMFKPEPEKTGKAECMIERCRLKQIPVIIEYCFKFNIWLFLIKKLFGTILEAESATALKALVGPNRNLYGFGIRKNFYKEAKEKTLSS